ncbi:MAG: DNA-methyltransferase [Candidatus Hodarchaeales archaeon]|jgi:DNA modification methylase
MNDHRILYGDVWSCLTTLNDEYIDCTITSPPYWSQRDYGFDGQIGNEPDIVEYFSKLVTIFGLLKQKLNKKGVFFLNLGDKYLSKYGNTPLGMIPYRLAFYLVQDGWILEDTLIWYKPNHMPSSVKNRFTNTYEPVFVLVKDPDNYFADFKIKTEFSKILKIPLQPVPYKHMATFPEKLVEELLKQGLPDDALILDPFAGTGTTCKAVQNLCRGYFNPLKMQSIMIEAFKDYVRIIKERCNIKSENIQKLPFKSFTSRINLSNFQIPINNGILPQDFDIQPSKVIIKLFGSSKEFITFIPLLFDGSLDKILIDDGICFIGLPDHNIERFFNVIQANNHGWIIRNVLIVPQGNDWIPIFMLVKDIKSVRYKFNLDTIRITHRFKNVKKWTELDFVGFKVEKSNSIFKVPDLGLIAKILSYYPNSFPHWVVVKWDSKNYTLEEVLDGSLEKRIKMNCPMCTKVLGVYYQYNQPTSCPSCSEQLWTKVNTIPMLSEVNSQTAPDYNHEEIDITEKQLLKTYSGKFKDSARINLGQSPGARVSVEEQYFAVQRYYDVNQSMISDFINLNRKKKGLSKTELTKKYPPEYKHTVGHWLRKDMGGSLPKYEDLMKLDTILELDKEYLNYISRTGLKLQTVIADVKGKNPGDFLDIPLEKVIRMFRKLGE